MYIFRCIYTHVCTYIYIHTFWVVVHTCHRSPQEAVTGWLIIWGQPKLFRHEDQTLLASNKKKKFSFETELTCPHFTPVSPNMTLEAAHRTSTSFTAVTSAWEKQPEGVCSNLWLLGKRSVVWRWHGGRSCHAAPTVRKQRDECHNSTDSHCYSV